jgi:hypothetical protein
MVSVVVFNIQPLDSITIVDGKELAVSKPISDGIAITESVQEIPELWYTMVRCGASCCHAGL